MLELQFVQAYERDDVHLEGVAQELLVGGLVGAVHAARPCGELQAIVLGAERNGALEVARIGTAYVRPPPQSYRRCR